MARIDVLMPQMGESIAEGTVSKWLKKVGEQVKRDEPLFEISTDKVDAEIPSPVAGVLAEIKVQEGQTVAVTGFAGRVTRQDILGFIEGAAVAAGPTVAPAMRPVSPASPSPAILAPPPPVPAGRQPPSPRPAGAGAPAGPVEHPVVEPWPGDRVEPFSKIRKITADHMVMSRRVSAHVTSFFEVDYTRVAELRRKHKQAYAER